MLNNNDDNQKRLLIQSSEIIIKIKEKKKKIRKCKYYGGREELGREHVIEAEQVIAGEP